MDYKELNINEGEKWRKRWDKQLESLVRTAYFKVVFLWVVLEPLLCTMLIGGVTELNGGRVDAAVSGGIVGFTIVIVLLVSITIVSSAKNKVAKEKVLLQQAIDLRYLAEYVKREGDTERR